jgi:hypothetical protein
MKKVILNGKEYNIEFSDYGYSSSRFVVNGQQSSHFINNDQLLNVDSFKYNAKKAIDEYENRKTAQQNFKEWDGSL